MSRRRPDRRMDRAFQAYNRQRRYEQLHGARALDPMEMLPTAGRETRNIDLRSWGFGRATERERAS